MKWNYTIFSQPIVQSHIIFLIFDGYHPTFETLNFVISFSSEPMCSSDRTSQFVISFLAFLISNCISARDFQNILSPSLNKHFKKLIFRFSNIFFNESLAVLLKFTENLYHLKFFPRIYCVELFDTVFGFISVPYHLLNL